MPAAGAGGRPSAGAAFTVLELLVVIGVIAVLMAVMVPSLSQARESGRRAYCAANLRQLGIATHLYADTYDGFLPRRGQGVQPTRQITRPSDWFNALPVAMGQPSYMDLAAAGHVPRPGDRSYLVCPSAVDTGSANFWSYGMNMWLSVWDNGPLNLPDKIGSVGPPQSMVLLADGPANYCSVSPAPAALGYSPVARHRGMVNVGFLDAHVESLAGSYVGCGTGFVEHADVRWRVPGSSWASAQH